MQHLKIGGYSIIAWAERLPNLKWHGLATIEPPIPNTWTGGPSGCSLVTDGEEVSEHAAESKAMDEAATALRAHIANT